MKRLIAMVLATLMLLTASAGLAERLAGGWEIHDNAAAELPEGAREAFDRALDGLPGATYVPVSLLASQVVAGMNYCILCEVTPVVPDAVPGYALVYIYADLQGGAEISNVVPLDIGALRDSGIETE